MADIVLYNCIRKCIRIRLDCAQCKIIAIAIQWILSVTQFITRNFIMSLFCQRMANVIVLSLADQQPSLECSAPINICIKCNTRPEWKLWIECRSSAYSKSSESPKPRWMANSARTVPLRSTSPRVWPFELWQMNECSPVRLSAQTLRKSHIHSFRPLFTSVISYEVTWEVCHLKSNEIETYVSHLVCI